MPLVRDIPLQPQVDLDLGLHPFVRGAGDPTSSRRGDGWWFAWHTPDGPVTLHLRRTPEGARAGAWGDGAPWMLDRVPHLLGVHDDLSGFVPHDEVVSRAWETWQGWRIAASGLVLQTLVCAVLEQRVTGREAFASQRMLVRRHGSPAPGPGAELGLVVPPSAKGWRRIPSWEWLRAGVDRARSRVVMTATEVAGRLDGCAALPLPEARARLRGLPGVGVWTAAEVAQRALGDPDSPSFGDYHLARQVTWALTGESGDDAAMEQALAPYAGHRYRAARIIATGGPQPPRRGPRRSLPTHLPVRW